MEGTVKNELSKLMSYRSFVHAVSGAVGGFTAMTVFYPLDTVRVILQVDDEAKAKTLLDVTREILRQQGLTGLYRGWFPVVSSLWCSNFVYFYSYNFLKLVLIGKSKPTPVTDLTAASIAGIINVLTTTPMWVVNTRLKLQRPNKTYSLKDEAQRPKYRGILDCFHKIIQNEGVGALWNGTLPSLMLVCNPTIQFVVYEALKRRFLKLLSTTELSSAVLFFIGATAKAVATVITYPIQVLQSRLRAQSKGNASRPMGLQQCMNHILRTNGLKGFYKGIEAKLLQTILMAALMFLTYEKISYLVFQIMSPQ